jgi:hypothetical protein
MHSHTRLSHMEGLRMQALCVSNLKSFFSTTRHEGALGRGGIAPTHYRPRKKMGVCGQRHAPAAL